MKTFALLFACALSASAQVTFSETIAPILYENCVTCHRPGEAAPFSLISYEDVAKRGALIAAVTASRYMPPWHAAHGFGDFVNERRLTDEQIATIGAWVKAGMPRGDASKIPRVPQFTEGWQLGTPDLVLELPAGFNVPADGPDVYRNFVFPIGLAEDRWVRAVEFRPSARRAVHHALFAYVARGAFAQRDGADGKPGFSGAMSVGVAPGQAASGGLGGWAVGGSPMTAPEGAAMSLPKGSDFLLQLHFHPTGKVETERSVVGIYFGDTPTKRLASVEMPSLFGFGAGLDIPQGEANYTIRDSFTLPGDAKVYSAIAHAHYIGKEMKVTATLPDGSTKPLLWINDWDFNWQDVYVYKEPVILPKGTRLDAMLRYDNSADNPRNPSNPPKRVLWGEESFDEMGTVGLVFEILNAEEEAGIREALNARTRAAIQAGIADGTVQRYLQHQREVSGVPPQPQRLQQIGLLDREGKTIALLGPPATYSQPALSPDGTRVAVVRDRNIWIYEVRTGTGTRITREGAPSSPVWSPDGTELAYVASATIYRTRADGSGAAELLHKPSAAGAVFLTDWSSGKLCYWSGNSMFVVAPGGEAVEWPSARGGRLSPDGRSIAYSSNASGDWATYVAPLDKSSEPRRVSQQRAIGGISWRQDNRELYFLTTTPPALMAAEIPGEPHPLFPVPAGVGAPAQLSSIATPDGQRFVFLTAADATPAAK